MSSRLGLGREADDLDLYKVIVVKPKEVEMVWFNSSELWQNFPRKTMAQKEFFRHCWWWWLCLWSVLWVWDITQSGKAALNLLSLFSARKSFFYDSNDFESNDAAPYNTDLIENQSVVKFSRLLWTPKTHFEIYKNPPLNPVPLYKNPVQIDETYFFKIGCNIIVPSVPSSRWYFTFRFSA